MDRHVIGRGGGFDRGRPVTLERNLIVKSPGHKGWHLLSSRSHFRIAQRYDRILSYRTKTPSLLNTAKSIQATTLSSPCSTNRLSML